MTQSSIDGRRTDGVQTKAPLSLRFLRNDPRSERAHVTAAHRVSETLDDSFVFPGTFAVQSHRGSVNVSLKSNTPIAAAEAGGRVEEKERGVVN